LTITGGKWTTYRNMAEDCINQAAAHAELPQRVSGTRQLAIHGATASATAGADGDGALALYGTDAAAIRELADERGLSERLHVDFPSIEAEVVWAARHEWARTVEDVLARRTRLLFLDARVAISVAPRVAELLAAELNLSHSWQSEQVAAFQKLATGYLVENG
jgi:glycerol-3-phosphate dehydrogenase